MPALRADGQREDRADDQRAAEQAERRRALVQEDDRRGDAEHRPGAAGERVDDAQVAGAYARWSVAK